MSRHRKTKPSPTPAPTATDPTVADYVAQRDAQEAVEAERRRLADAKPLTIREAAQVLAGLRRLAWIVKGGR